MNAVPQNLLQYLFQGVLRKSLLFSTPMQVCVCFGLHKKTVELSAAKEEKILPADTFFAFPNVKRRGKSCFRSSEAHAGAVKAVALDRLILLFGADCRLLYQSRAVGVGVGGSDLQSGNEIINGRRRYFYKSPEREASSPFLPPLRQLPWTGCSEYSYLLSSVLKCICRTEVDAMRGNRSFLKIDISWKNFARSVGHQWNGETVEKFWHLKVFLILWLPNLPPTVVRLSDGCPGDFWFITFHAHLPPQKIQSKRKTDPSTKKIPRLSIHR